MLTSICRSQRVGFSGTVSGLLLACIGAASLTALHPLEAATLTWSGAAGDGNLFTNGNWSPGQTPATGDALIFAGSTSLTNTFSGTAFSAAAITFNATAGAFVINGSNTLTISGAAGITTSSTATQTLNTRLALGISQTWTTATGGSLAVGGNVALSTFSLTLAGAGTTTLNGVLSGTGGLSRGATSTGTLAINGANTFSGATSLSFGTVQIGNNAALGTGTVTFAGTALRLEAIGGARTLANNLIIGNTTTFQGTNNLTFTGGASLTGSRSFAVNGTGIVSLNGVVSQSTATARTLTKSGTGTLILNGINTFTGGVNLSSGVLQAGNSNAFGTGTIQLGSGTLQAGGSPLIFANALSLTGNTIFSGNQNITFNGNGALTGNRIQTVNSTGIVTYNGAISGAAFLYKQGPGTMAFTGTTANTFSGLTYIYDGTLLLGKTAG